MKKKRVTILTTKWGHLSIARGVQDALKSTYPDTEVADIEMEQFSDDFYMIFYRFFPSLFKVPYKMAEKNKLNKYVKQYLIKAYKDDVMAKLKKSKPDIIINTYLAFIPILEEYCKKKNKILVNIVPDPRTFSRITISDFGYNMVFDKVAFKNCLKMGIKREKIVKSGWFVQEKFEEDYSKDEVRKRLGLTADKLTILVIGGSAGNYGVLKLLPAFFKPSKPIHIIFICGSNEQLYKSLKTISDIMNNSKGSKLKISVFGFKDNVHEFMQASDIVLGKAGPNLLFESVATKTPFIAISHIAGQEDGNLEIIKQKNLGYVRESQRGLVSLLKKIILHPTMLDKFEKPLNEMKQYNKQSKIVINQFLDQITTQK